MSTSAESLCMLLLVIDSECFGSSAKGQQLSFVITPLSLCLHSGLDSTYFGDDKRTVISIDTKPN